MSVNTREAHTVPRLRLSPVLLIRLSAILVVGLMLGHMSAYPWASARSPAETQLVGGMKALDFMFMGQHQTYWALYFGWGLLVGVLLLALAITLWMLGDIARLAPRAVGAITGVLSATCLVGAYLSFRFFYLPPTVFFSVICVLLLAATAQLLGEGSRREARVTGPRPSQG